MAQMYRVSFVHNREPYKRKHTVRRYIVMAENAHAARAKALAEDVADMSKVTAIWVREIEDGIARGGIVWMTPAEVEAWSNERAAAGEG